MDTNDRYAGGLEVLTATILNDFMTENPLNRETLRQYIEKYPLLAERLCDVFLECQEAIALTNLLMTLKGSMVLNFNYTNYRGERSERRVIPEKVWIGSTEWHPEPCLLMTAYDIDKAAHRDFKVSDIDPVSWTAERV